MQKDDHRARDPIEHKEMHVTHFKPLIMVHFKNEGLFQGPSKLSHQPSDKQMTPADRSRVTSEPSTGLRAADDNRRKQTVGTYKW